MNINENDKILIYRFMSQAFSYPNQVFISNLQEILTKNKKLSQKFTSLVENLREKPLELLQAEYTRLFISGYPETPCPPYESFYLEGKLLGEAALQVISFYEDWGLTVDPSLCDHLSTELEFMAFLTAATNVSEITEKAKLSKEKFYQNHLKKWVPQFLTDLQNYAQIKEYKKIAILLRDDLF